jgi:hypothetical protein
MKPTYRAVNAVDPLHVACHGVNARLFTPTHVLVKQVVRLKTVQTLFTPEGFLAQGLLD